jgi:lysophospholipase L1-like esterase
MKKTVSSKCSESICRARRQRSADTAIRFTVVLIATILLGFSVFLLFTLYPGLRASAAAPTSVQPTDNTLPSTADAGMDYQNTLTFVGDSLTAHMRSRGVLEGGTATTQVWATQSGMLNLNSDITSAKIICPGTDQAVTISEAARLLQPPVLIVTLGTDWGVSYLSESEFKYCYGKLIRSIADASPDTIVVLQSIFPVLDSCAVLSNRQIDRANGWIRDLAVEYDLPYLDTQSVLKDGSGALRADYCNADDGIHLTASAYRAILTYIRTHAVAPPMPR